MTWSFMLFMQSSGIQIILLGSKNKKIHFKLTKKKKKKKKKSLQASLVFFQSMLSYLFKVLSNNLLLMSACINKFTLFFSINKFHYN